MNRTKESIERDEVGPYLNQLVLDGGFHVVRLLGVSEDKDDYYYIFQYPGKRTHERDHYKGIVHHSCVGTFYPLKGKIDDEHYNEMERLWEINKEYWK